MPMPDRIAAKQDPMIASQFAEVQALTEKQLRDKKAANTAEQAARAAANLPGRGKSNKNREFFHSHRDKPKGPTVKPAQSFACYGVRQNTDFDFAARMQEIADKPEQLTRRVGVTAPAPTTH